MIYHTSTGALGDRFSSSKIFPAMLGLLLLLAQHTTLWASQYKQEAGVYFTANADDTQQQTNHGSVLGADFTYYFAPLLLSGPITQHGYWQKVSQLHIKSEHEFSDTRNENRSSSDELSATLYPPGKSYYVDLGLSNSTLWLSSNKHEKLNQSRLELGVLGSRKLRYGVQLRQADAVMATMQLDLLARYSGNSKGIFVKKILQSTRNIYLLYQLSYSAGHIDPFQSAGRNFKDSEFRLAFYPDRHQEWAMQYRQIRIDKTASFSNTRLLSYTRYFNSSLGSFLQFHDDKNLRQNQRGVSVGLKVRL